MTRSPVHVRLRRAGALGGILAAVVGAVGLRSTLAPAATPALSAPTRSVDSPSTSRQPGLGDHRASAANPLPHRIGQLRPTHRRILGKRYDVGYGVVRVRVTLDGRRISDVTPLSLPEGGRSSDISAYAAPQLRREALAAQSARIDTVSGASYTSAGYARSLQSALDQAGR